MKEIKDIIRHKVDSIKADIISASVMVSACSYDNENNKWIGGYSINGTFVPAMNHLAIKLGPLNSCIERSLR